MPTRRIKLFLNKLLYKLHLSKKVSETSKCRSSLAPFCTGSGIDIGFGGDPIVPHAICIDMLHAYAQYKTHVQHLHGDAQSLHWFQDGSLDFIYSSHVLEDFRDTRAVLDEWLRVVKPGGYAVLYLPDEQAYRAYCKSQDKLPNPHHVHEHFSLLHVKNAISHRSDIKIIHERYPVGIYSFELVLKKSNTSQLLC
jgi:predicted SAM-dependent methyltransferase